MSRASTIRGGIIALFCLLFASGPSYAQTGCDGPAAKLVGGLEGKICLAGTTSTNTSVVVRLENNSKNAVQILLVGPEPQASDNVGNKYLFSGAFAGAAACRDLGAAQVDGCIGMSRSGNNAIAQPLEAYTQIDPGTAISLSFRFNGQNNPGTLLTLSSVFAYRIVHDELKDPTLSEAERRKQIRTMSVSFSPYPMTPQNRIH